LEGKVQRLLLVFEKVSFQRIDLIEPVFTDLWNRRICFCSQQILNVGVTNEKGAPIIKRRKTSFDRLHAESDGRYVFGW
jgi:hypothetical protein